MSDANASEPTDVPEPETVIIPTQASPQDTSNWDDRPFSTPNGRIVIETFQGNDNKVSKTE